MYKIIEIEGIGEVYADKLIAAEVKLLKICSKKQLQRRVAKSWLKKPAFLKN